jgi:hypothetical protein
LLTTWHNSLPHWCGHPCFTLEPRNQTPPESSVNPCSRSSVNRAEASWPCGVCTRETKNGGKKVLSAKLPHHMPPRDHEMRY